MQRNRPFTAHLIASKSFKKKATFDYNEDEVDEFYFTSYTNLPVDYENYIIRNKSLLMNDRNSELLFFPPNDIKMYFVSRGVKNGSLPGESVPKFVKSKFDDSLSISNPLTRHMLSYFLKPQWLCVNVGNINNRGNYLDIPREECFESILQLRDNWFLIDSKLRLQMNKKLQLSDESFNMNTFISQSSINTGASRRYRRGTVQTSLPAPVVENTDHNILLNDENTIALGHFAIYSYSDYQKFMQSVQTLSSHNFSGSNPLSHYCLRSMESYELAYMESNRQSKHLGSYIIIPQNCKIVHGTDLTKLIFLDSICDVKCIGTLWLRLELKVTSKPFKSSDENYIFLQFPSDIDEPQINVDEISRDEWLKQLKLVIKLENQRSRFGYSFPAAVRKITQDVTVQERIQDIKPISICLSKETENSINKNRQKDRMKLITLYPELRLSLEVASQSSAARQEKISNFQNALLSGSEYCSSLSSEPDATKHNLLLPFAHKLNKSVFVNRNSSELSNVKFMATCQSFQTYIRAPVDNPQGSGSLIDNPEPFFISIFLIDAIEGKRISEEFYCDLNSSSIRAMLNQEITRQPPWNYHDSSNQIHRKSPPPPAPVTPLGLPTPPHDLLAKSRSCIFSVFAPALSMAISKALSSQMSFNKGASDLGTSEFVKSLKSYLVNNLQSMNSLKHYFIVVRVEKVLSGSSNVVLEKYAKAGQVLLKKPSDLTALQEPCKIGISINKSMQLYCRNIGSYRMPFAWGCRPLISRSTDVRLFKWDLGKFSENCLISQVQNVHRLCQQHGFNAFDSSSFQTTMDMDGLEKIPTDVLEKSLKASAIAARFVLTVKLLDPVMLSDLVQVNSNLAIIHSPYASPSLIPENANMELNVVKVLEHFMDQYGSCGDLFPGFNDSLVNTSASGKTPELDIISLSSLNARDSMFSASSNFLSANERLSAYLDQFLTATASSSSSSLNIQSSTLTISSKDTSNNVVDPTANGGSTFEFPTEVNIWQPPVPHTEFFHNLYIYPKSLNFNCKHGFNRARNLSCFIELRENDDLTQAPLKSFYLKEGSRYKNTAFDSWLNTNVLYHDSSPQFNEEIKVCLPFELTTSHHLLFRFYHVSCDTAGSVGLNGDKSSSTGNSNEIIKQLESPTGFAWIPLLTECLNLQNGVFHLPISQDLHSGYLNGLGPTPQPRKTSLARNESVNGHNLHWIENGKPLFTVDIIPFSSVYTTDSKIASFFTICSQRLGPLASLKPQNGNNIGDSARNSRSVTFSENSGHTESSKPELGHKPSINLKNNPISFTQHSNALSNAIKSLLLAKQRTVVQFLPALLNQFMEIFYIVCKNGEMRYQTCSKLEAERGWLDSYGIDSNGTPGDLLKTAIGNLSMLVAENGSWQDAASRLKKRTLEPLRSSLTNFGYLSNNGPFHDFSKSHILDQYVQFEFDQTEIHRKSLEWHGLTDPTKLAFNSSAYFLPLHHCLVRAMICILSDVHCPPHNLLHFLLKLQFFFDLIIKGATQHLCYSKRIYMDRTAEIRFPKSFSDDVTKLVRLLSLQINQICNIPQQQASKESTIDRKDSNPKINENSSQHNVGSLNKISQGKDLYALIGKDLAHSTAYFLLQLFNLMNRGFVLERVRDLMVAVEIKPRMSVLEIDRCNELRCQMLHTLFEYEYFVQLNLPSLTSTYQSDRRDDFTLTDKYLEEHYLIGLLLQPISCMLVHCSFAGGLEDGHSKEVYRQPLIILRNQLAKHVLDTRYAKSKQYLSRIALLYAPFVHLVLDNVSSFSLPNEASKASLEARRAKAEIELATQNTSNRNTKVKRKNTLKPPTSLEFRSRHLKSQKKDVISQRSGSDILSIDAQDSNIKPIGSYSISMVSNSTLSRKSSLQTTNNAVSNFRYTNKDGKVDQLVLEQIAGVSQGSTLGRLQLKRRVSGRNSTLIEDVLLPSDNSSDDTDSILTGDGSSITDTIQDDDDLENEDDLRTPENETIPSWTEQVLNIAGVLNGSTNNQDLANGQEQTRKLSSSMKLKRDSLEISEPSMIGENKLQKSSSYSSSLAGDSPGAIKAHVHRVPEFNEGMPHLHLSNKCQKEALICTLQILSLLDDNSLGNLLRLMSSSNRLHFLRMLIYSIYHLKYKGKSTIDHFRTGGISNLRETKNTTSHREQNTSRHGSLVRYKRGESALIHLAAIQYGLEVPELSPEHNASNLDDSNTDAKLSAHLANEAGLIILDVLNVFCTTFRSELDNTSPSSPLFRAIIEVIGTLLNVEQSETVLIHSFAFTRVFVNRFSKVLFCESNDTLGMLCEAILRCSNLSTTSSMEHGTENDLDTILDVATVTNLRLDACSLLYRIWRNSFERFGKVGFRRVHLQTIISISKLVNEIGPEFEASLSLLSGLAKLDVQKSSVQPILSQTPGQFIGSLNIDNSYTFQCPLSKTDDSRLFLNQVNDLIKRIQGVLVATAEMRKHRDDHTRLVDLHYSLAKSYASNPALRKTWLEELYKLHESNRSVTEAAMAKLHIAALSSEYLKQRGEFPQGCQAFFVVSDNISTEEGQTQADPTLVEMACTHDELLIDIQQAAVAMAKAGMWECLKPIYDLIIPVYETRRDWTMLANIYHHLGSAYESVLKAESGAQRLFASYYRVSFFGQPFETQAGKNYIYRSNPCFKLHDMCHLLMQTYTKKYGADKIELLADSFILPSSADMINSGKGYLLVSFVEPFTKVKSESSKSPNKVVDKNVSDCNLPATAFQSNHNIRFFKFETPFTRLNDLNPDECLATPGLSRQTDDLAAQWKRRTILETSAAFPHLRTRLEVVRQVEINLSPIDSAIDSIMIKNKELELYITPKTNTVFVSMEEVDEHKSSSLSQTNGSMIIPNRIAAKNHSVPLIMDMRLQGALLPTVNQGPMAYAYAFLSLEGRQAFLSEKVDELKLLFLKFLSNCHILLKEYAPLLIRANAEKFRAMKSSLDKYRIDLSNLLNEEVSVDEITLRYFVKSSNSSAN